MEAYCSSVGITVWDLEVHTVMVSVCLVSWMPSEEALMTPYPDPEVCFVRASAAVTGLRSWSFDSFLKVTGQVTFQDLSAPGQPDMAPLAESV